MKKILLVTNIYPPHIGGPATFIDKLAHKLARDGYKVTVICSSDEEKEHGDKERPFRVIRVCMKIREWYEIKVRLVLLWQLLMHHKILVNGLETYVSQVTKFIRRKYILKVVGDMAWETARNRGSSINDIDMFQTDNEDQAKHESLVAVRNNFIAKANMVITPSKYLKNMVAGWGVPREKIKVVCNGVEPTERNEPKNYADERLKILFVGRLTNWKGVETILLAVCQLDNVLLKVAGDGPAYPMLVALSAQLRIEDKVIFLGKKNHYEIGKLMHQADVLVLLSLYEGMSHTILEAISSGIPVIASNRGGNPEVIENSISGFLIDPLSVSPLVDLLTEIRDSPELRDEISKNALIRSKEFELDNTVRQVCEILER